MSCATVVAIAIAALGATAGPASDVSVAEAWLALVDSGRYGESWDALSSMAQGEITRTVWITYLEAVRKPLGSVKKRLADGEQSFDSLPGRPDYKGKLLRYQAVFDGGGPVAEVVGLILEKDGTWKAYAYDLSIASMFRGSAEDYFKLGNVYYLRRNYEKAIENYVKALDKEKHEPTLEKDHLLVLIDNLGMSYGLTRNYKAAQETFEYGIDRDGSYPMFYYNLACNYAEQGLRGPAIRFLKMAFARRANMIRGEVMPNPAADPSFKPFLDDPEFRKAIEDLHVR